MNMNESAGPLGDVNMGDIGAALAAAGSQAGQMDAGAGAPAGGQAPGGAPAGGQAGAKGQAAPVQSLDFILDIPLKVDRKSVV